MFAMAMPPEVQQAFERSYLSHVDSDRLRALMDKGSLLQVPGKFVVDRGDSEARLALVVSGAFRMYLASEDGRQVVIRYARAGDIMGTPALFFDPSRASDAERGLFEAAGALTVETYEDSLVWLIPTPEFRALAENETNLALAVAGEISRRLFALMGEISRNAFDDVRRRLARHLLELAGPDSAPSHPNDRLDLRQQELADAVGSVREVVARILRDWRGKELLESGPEGITLLDRNGLREIAER